MPHISPFVRPFTSLALIALVALPAIAQVNAPSASTTPATLSYRSAFSGYQPFSEEKVKPWKESNATVEKIGGWRAYAKEAAEPEAKNSQTQAESPAASPKTPKAPADPHAGHGKH